MDDPGSIILTAQNVAAAAEAAAGDDAGGIIFKILLLFVLILVNAFFAMSEIAIISLNDNMIDKMAEDGNKKARQVQKLTENPSNFLSTIQIGVTLAGFYDIVKTWDEINTGNVKPYIRRQQSPFIALLHNAGILE